MNQKEKMEKDLLNEIDGYVIQLSYLQDLMSVEEDVDNLSKKMQQSPNFTLIVKCALVDSYMVAFMKLYDKSYEAKTIPNLIKKCQNNIDLFSSKEDVRNKLCEFETRLKENEYIVDAIEKIRFRRDSLYAHNDGKYFGVKMQNDTSYLPMYELWFLRDFTEEVLKFLLAELTHNEYKKTKYDGDLKNLF